MDKNILQERIQQALRSHVMREGLTDVNVVPATDAEGNMTLDIQTSVGEIKMDDDTSAAIAIAVATAVVDFLTKDVVVTVENGTAGSDTLTGVLE
jgi:hypothetical protein